VALLGEVKEIFILANNDALLKFGVAPNVAVNGVAQARFQDVLTIESAIAKISSEGER